MLNDEQRNSAIERAISDLPLAGKTVVEIGTGTGLIALMFARAGAKSVVSCEMNENLADIAQQIIDSTPYADRITLIDKSSSQAISEGLIEPAPDYIFTETLDCGVIGEHYFDIAQDIRRLAGPDTTVIPSEIRQIGVVIESQDILNQNTVGDVCGFDLSALNTFSTATYFPVREALYNFRALCSPAIVRRYEYITSSPAIVSTCAIDKTGSAAGVLSWMEIQFGDYVLSNAPGTGSHWHKAFHPFAEPVSVVAGDELKLKINDDGSVTPRLLRQAACAPRSVQAAIA